MFVSQTLSHFSTFLNGAESTPGLGIAFFDREKGHLRLRTLVMLRWLAIFGQTALVLLVAYGFHFHLRIWLCLSVIMASLWLNVLLSLGRRKTQRLQGWEAALQLGFDAVQLTALLGVTGGLNNPFCLLLLAPATVAAANLPTRHGLGVVLVCLASSVSLEFWSFDLPWMKGDVFVLPEMYRLGFLIAILVGICFTAGYAWLAAIESSRMEQALAATQAVLEKEHRLSALGGLAAAAAHELGTPLGTIQVVAKEMLHNLTKKDPLYDDALLLVSQSQRCRDILKSLSAKPETHDSVNDQMPLRAFLDMAAAPFIQSDKAIHIEVSLEGAQDDVDIGRKIMIRRRPEWHHAISAFIENAADFARSHIWVRVHIHKGYVSLKIEDDGPGFTPDILSRLGDPYVSSRGYNDEVERTSELAHLGQPAHTGMGLGIFIAKTLCEYTGAAVTFGNREPSGACVKVLWRRDQIDISLTEEVMV